MCHTLSKQVQLPYRSVKELESCLCESTVLPSCCGYSYIEFKVPLCTHTPPQGRLIHILPANRPPAVEKSGLAADEGEHGKAAGSSSFKTEREQQRKNDAGACAHACLMSHGRNEAG